MKELSHKAGGRLLNKVDDSLVKLKLSTGVMDESRYCLYLSSEGYKTMVQEINRFYSLCEFKNPIAGHEYYAGMKIFVISGFLHPEFKVALVS